MKKLIRLSETVPYGYYEHDESISHNIGDIITIEPDRDFRDVLADNYISANVITDLLPCTKEIKAKIVGIHGNNTRRYLLEQDWKNIKIYEIEYSVKEYK